MTPPDPLLLRQQARAAKAARDAALLDLHRAAAKALASENGGDVRRAALARVDLWEREHLCSMRYVHAWRRILGLPSAAAAADMLRPDGEGPALRQNTPFGFLHRA